MAVTILAGRLGAEGDDHAMGSDDEEEVSALEMARTALREAAAAMGPGSGDYVCPGDPINVLHEDGFLRGHGTFLVEGRLVATVAGVVERVNKLVSVRPVKSRYVAECGDVLVGRVGEVAGKRWKVDINARQAAVLMLSAVNLPGGIQRRRTHVDELNMRAVFEDGDLISAEVQQIMQDGTVSLHTRQMKYGKLEGGQLVEVPPALIKRQKQHFHHVEELRVDVIFGCNGLVWVGAHVEPPQDADPAAVAAAADGVDTVAAVTPRASVGTVPVAVRISVARVANVVRVLARLFLPIHLPAVLALAAAAVEEGVDTAHVLGEAFQARVLEWELQRRTGELCLADM